MTEQNDQSTWDPLQRDYAVGELIKEITVYQFQIPDDDDGRWQIFDSPKEDRDTVTRSQAFGLRKHSEEKQRVLRFETRVYVDEVVGDGEGETSPDAVIARNEEITQRLLQDDAAKKQ